MKDLTDKPSQYVVSYAEALRLDKMPIKRPKKLQCRPGYVQRGAVCQKIGNIKTQKPTAVKSKGVGGGLAKLAVGAVAAGAAGALAVKAATSKNQLSKPSNLPEVPQEKLDQVIKHPASKPYLKAAAIAGVSTATVATAIAVSHPRIREQMIDRAGLNDNLYEKAAKGAIDYKDLTEAQKRGHSTVRKIMQQVAPKTSPSGEYQVDTDMDSLAADLREQFKKNQAEIKKLPSGHKKLTKLQNQQSLLYGVLVMHKKSKEYDPSIVVMGFRDKEGKLVGINASAPSYQHEALEFSGFAVFEGAPTTAAKDIMATNKELSKRLGMRGRMVGQPFEEAKPIYKRYGAKPIPGTENDWIFEGDEEPREKKEKKDSLSLRELLLFLRNENYCANIS